MGKRKCKRRAERRSSSVFEAWQQRCARKTINLAEGKFAQWGNEWRMANGEPDRNGVALYATSGREKMSRRTGEGEQARGWASIGSDDAPVADDFQRLRSRRSFHFSLIRPSATFSRRENGLSTPPVFITGRLLIHTSGT